MAVPPLLRSEYQPLLRTARWLLGRHPDVTLLADRGFVYHNVGLWEDGEHRCNLVLATVKGVKEPPVPLLPHDPHSKKAEQHYYDRSGIDIDRLAMLNRFSSQFPNKY